MKYPMTFTAETSATAGMNTLWNSHSEGGETRIAIPKEFEGPGGGQSPEDLFNLALANCFVATFKVFAEKSAVTFTSMSVSSRLVVDLDASRRPVMKDFFLNATIRGASHPERTQSLALKAASSGFVLNSVKTQLHFQLHVEGMADFA